MAETSGRVLEQIEPARRRGAGIRLLLAAILTGGLVAACNPLPYAKLVTDDVDNSFSLVTEEECDLQNIFRGVSYCQRRLVLREAAPVYCYRTLGVPDCYAQADPYAGQRSGRRVTPPMALGDAVAGAVRVAPDLSVQYMGGEAVPDGSRAIVPAVVATEAVPVMIPPPAMPRIPVEMQALPPKSTLRTSAGGGQAR